ncbi:MAG: NYN domain-containing protein, partial [Methanomassiliicoccales archaeon]
MSSKRAGITIWPPDIPDIILPSIGGNIDPVTKVHYFTSVDKDNASQVRFLNHISKSGIIVYDFELKCYPDGNECPTCNDHCPDCGRDLRHKPHKEKKVDIAVATKMIELAYQKDPSFDTFVILSGDKDLIPSIQALTLNLKWHFERVPSQHPDIVTSDLALDLVLST